MVAGVASSPDSAHGSGPSGARARINALVAIASLVSRAILQEERKKRPLDCGSLFASLIMGSTYGVIDTLAATTRHERIAEVSSATEADGSVVATAVHSGFAVRIQAARVRVAKVVCINKGSI